MKCDCAGHSVEASGAFDYMIEAALLDFMAYQALIDRFADPLARLIEQREASFVCRRFLRTLEGTSAMWVPGGNGRRRIECATIDLIRAEGIMSGCIAARRTGCSTTPRAMHATCSIAMSSSRFTARQSTET